uniref:NTF2 domain-containing protein n=1 Tax=Glycine max TaxID=3847 RepID=A0A0R0F284_SOYBN
MDPDASAKAFVEQYYSTFDTNRNNLPCSLSRLRRSWCQHSITTVDSQPSAVNSAMLVFVSGNLQLAGEQHSLKFSQMFHLIPTPQGSYYVLNDIFRLNYA